MSRAEVIAIMTAIRAAYPNYYKNQAEVNDAINLWAEMLADDKAEYIAKAVKEFIKTDTSGFPPTIGQIRTRAREIHIADIEKSKRNLPEPETKAIPMTPELREMLEKWLKGTEA